jgi:PAS domain S-box-containing protein
MKLAFHQKIQIGFLSALIFLVLIGGIGWWSAKQNQETFLRVTHTHQVVDELQEILTDALNVESGARGFAISGNEKFLASYSEGLAGVQRAFANLKQLTADNASQQQRLTALEPLLHGKITSVNEIISRKRQGDATGALTLIAGGTGRQTMDEIRGVINAMQKEEEFLLRLRTDKSQRQLRFTMAVVGFGSLTAILLVTLAGYQVRRDYFKRQRVETALRESELHYRTLFDSIDQGFCIIELIFDDREKPVDYRFLEVNPAFGKHTGLRDVPGKRMRELVPKHEDRWFELYGRIATTGEPARFENWAEHLQRWYDVYAFRFGDPKSRQVAILFNDLTARKRMEEALRRSEENLAVTLNSIGDAVLTTDTQGNVTRMNPIAEKLTGWLQAEALGRPINEVFNIINETTRQPTEVPVAKVLATGEIHGLANHTIIIARDGTEIPIADSAAPIRDQNGQTLGVVLVFRDVTDEKRAERAVAESEHKLRDLNHELARLVEERSLALQATGRLAEAALDALSAHVAVLDDDGTIIATNQSWRDFAAHNELDLIRSGNGGNYLDLCQRTTGHAAEDAKKMAAVLREVIAGQRKDFTMEYACHSPTQKRWFLVSSKLSDLAGLRKQAKLEPCVRLEAEGRRRAGVRGVL